MNIEFLLNVLASLIAGFAFATILWSWHRLPYLLRIGRIRKAWSPFLDGDTVLIMTGRQGDLERSTTRASFNEARAMHKMAAFFSSMSAKFQLGNGIDDDLSAQEGKNLILLGSRNGNDMTKALGKKIPIMPVWYDSAGNLVIDETKYCTVPGGDRPVTEDYALLLRCSKMTGDRKKVMILAGNHGAATEAAAMFAMSQSGITAIAKRAGNNDFIAVIKTTVNNNVPEPATLEFLMAFDFGVDHEK